MLQIELLKVAKKISFSSKRINNANKNQNTNSKDTNLNNQPTSLNAKNSIDSKRIEGHSQYHIYTEPDWNGLQTYWSIE